jgi:hypothetical protein
MDSRDELVIRDSLSRDRFDLDSPQMPKTKIQKRPKSVGTMQQNLLKRAKITNLAQKLISHEPLTKKIIQKHKIITYNDANFNDIEL